MKKILLTFSTLSLVLVVVVVIFLKKKENSGTADLLSGPSNVSSLGSTETKVKDSQKNINRRTISSGPASSSAMEKSFSKSMVKNAHSPKNFLDKYPKTNLNFFQDSVQVLEGVVASLEKRPLDTPVGNFMGHFIYETPGDLSYQIVYSPENKLYGIFSGEIIVTGSSSEVLTVLEKNSFEVLYHNEVTQKVIFKVDHLNDLNQLLEIKSLVGTSTENIRPDIKYSRVRPL